MLFRSGDDGLDRIHRIGRHVLEFERDHVDVASKRTQRIEIVVGRGDLDIRHLTGWGVVVGRERVNAVPHLPGRDREHAAQLTAAEDAEGGARRDHAQAVYTYAINVLKLKAAAGTLGDDDVAYVNTWLQK